MMEWPVDQERNLALGSSGIAFNSFFEDILDRKWFKISKIKVPKKNNFFSFGKTKRSIKEFNNDLADKPAKLVFAQ